MCEQSRSAPARAEPSIREKLEWLRRPQAYRGVDAAVEVVETHMSWVFLTASYAYKLKKPVLYDVLDFRTLAARRRSCEAEVRLNRRLAPDIYLGVVPLTVDRAGTLALAGRGETIDWLVKMRRLPRARRLDHLAGHGRITEDDIRRLVAVLASFYLSADPVHMSAREYRRRFEAGAVGDLMELSKAEYRLDGRRVQSLIAAQLDFLHHNEALFAQRIDRGRIVEGHGDLRPEHVFLLPQPVIIDCLEFDYDFRVIDPADELSFFALECERLNIASVGAHVSRLCAERLSDEPGEALIRFYRVYRACRRAKIAIWHLREPDVRDAPKWRKRAEWYLGTAAADAEAGRRAASAPAGLQFDQ